MKAAFRAINPKYAPSLTYVICGKRHHLRMYGRGPGDVDKTGNLPCATFPLFVASAGQPLTQAGLPCLLQRGHRRRPARHVGPHVRLLPSGPRRPRRHRAPDPVRPPAWPPRFLLRA